MVHRHTALTLLVLGAGACSVGGPPLLEDDPRSGRSDDRARGAYEARPSRDPARSAATTRTVAVGQSRRVVIPTAEDGYRAPELGQTKPTDQASAGLAQADPLPLDEPLPPLDLAAPRDLAADRQGADAPLRALAAPGEASRVGAPDRVGASIGTGGLGDLDDSTAPLALGDAAQVPEAPPFVPDADDATLLEDDLDEVIRLADQDAAPPTATLAGRADALRRDLPSRTTPAFLPNAAEALAAINALRAEAGAAPVAYNPVLSAAARAHAQDLARRGEVTALSADGAGVIDRLDRAGYVPEAAASLVAGGYRDFAEALASWQGDRTERSRLLLEDAEEIGIALVEDRRSPYRYYIEMIVTTP